MNMHASFPASSVSASKRFHIAPRPDPVFAKIEAHRAAKQAYSDTCTYEDDFPNDISRKPRVDAHAGISPHPHYLNTDAEVRAFIKQRGSWSGPKKKLQTMQAGLLKALQADRISLKKAQDRAGFTAAAEAYQAASAAEDKTYAALLSTTPTTRAGMAALAEYVAENERMWLDEEKENACFKTLKMLAKCALRLKGAELN